MLKYWCGKIYYEYHPEFAVKAEGAYDNGRQTSRIKYVFYVKLAKLYDVKMRDMKYHLRDLQYYTYWFIVEYMHLKKQKKRHWSKRCRFVIDMFKVSYPNGMQELHELIKNKPEYV